MGNWIVPLDVFAQGQTPEDAAEIGGKGGRLAWLLARNFRVPRTHVVVAGAFRAALRELPPGFEPKSLLRASSTRALYARAEEARREIERVPLPRGLMQELEQLWAAYAGDDNGLSAAPWGLALRSSATAEDGSRISMAGLADTVLGVRGPAELADAIRRIWGSAVSGSAMTYLAGHGVRDVAMAIVIQPVIVSEASGVLFTHSPSAPDERLINATFGLGSLVASGHVAPDIWRLAATGGVLEASIVHKPSMVIVRGSGTETVPCAAPDEPSLSPDLLAELHQISVALGGHGDGGWDVEFAVARDAGALHVTLLQVRPITGRNYPAGGHARTLWSNANVGEALPGVATPLTWSVAGEFSEAGFRTAFAALGCTIRRGTTLVGNVYGRVYLNLTEFMQIARQVPWLDPRILLELGGGVGADAHPDLAALGLMDSAATTRARQTFLVRLPGTLTRLAREQLGLEARVAEFELIARRARTLHREKDLAIVPDDGLARSLRDAQRLLADTGAVMLTCASASLGSYLLLRGVLARGTSMGADQLAQKLITGIADLESAKPARALVQLADLFAQNRELAAWIRQGTARTRDELPPGRERSALDAFLLAFGDRGVREAELATPRWAEDSTPVVAMLRAALQTDTRASCMQNPAPVADELARTLSGLAAPSRMLAQTLVQRAQKAAQLREVMRAWVTTVLGMIRAIALEADRRLLKLMPELSTTTAIPSVFFLTADELGLALRHGRRDLAPIVRARRAEYTRNLARPDPPAFFVGAPPWHQGKELKGAIMRGVAACAGVVEGPARVLFGPQQMGDLCPGEILVVHATDVGWTPLFPTAAGIVTELGGALSHAAIVAREFGVPTVVNVAQATTVIKTGDRIRVDGDRGLVIRLHAGAGLQSNAIDSQNSPQSELTTLDLGHG
jgi:rifampicin phosphotransferase